MEDDRPLDVPELAEVPGQSYAASTYLGRGTSTRGGAAAQGGEEVPHEGGDVPPPLAERGVESGKHVEPVVEILTI